MENESAASETLEKESAEKKRVDERIAGHRAMATNIYSSWLDVIGHWSASIRTFCVFFIPLLLFSLHLHF
jgi:hypothetical protein